MLVEIADRSGLEFVHFNGMSGELFMVEMMGGGAALLDYDNDGDLDVFLVQGEMLGTGKTIADATIAPRHPLPLTDRLYRNDLGWGADGRRTLSFTDVTDHAVPESVGYGMGVASADFDNDGWPDLYVTNYGPNQLLRNNRDGTFSDVTRAAGVGDEGWSVSAAFLDYDRDGWLDLYVGNYLEYGLGGRTACATVTGAPDYCSPLNYPPQKDSLFRNLGDGTFRDLSLPAGLEAAFGPALGVVAADLNGDRWPDLYVATDATENQLWINQTDGTFVDEAVLAGCAVNEAGIPEGSMGIAVADFDGDRTLDLFMTHIAQETNTLYLNSGRAVFRETTRRSRLGVPSRPFTGFGTAAVDLDLDGWEDLYVANGAVQKLPALVTAGDPYPLRQRDAVFQNTGAATFEELDEEGALGAPQVSRGVADGDLDRDGDEDLVVVDSAAPVRLYRNDRPSSGVWLGIRALADRQRFHDALGARVVAVTTGGRRLLRRVATDGSYASASAPGVLVGAGQDESFAAVSVEWPAGGRTVWEGPPPGRTLIVARDRTGG